MKMPSLNWKKIIALVNFGDGAATKSVEWNGQIGNLFTNQQKIKNLKTARMKKSSSKKKITSQKEYKKPNKFYKKNAIIKKT